MGTRPTLVIANKNYSSWSMRGWLALRLAGIEFDEHKILFEQEDTDAEIQRLSPSGKVPALIVGDLQIWESLALVEYAAEQALEAGIWPRDPGARAVARSVSAEMHAGFSVLRSHHPMNVRARAARRELLPEVAKDVARIQTIWRECREKYGQGGEFLFGAFGGADAMYAPVATRFQTYDIPLAPVSEQYKQAVLSHPLVAEWIQAGAAEPERIEEYDRVIG